MELFFGVVISYLWFVENIDAKLFRIHLDDEFYTYTIDPSVSPYTDYCSTSNLSLEQIDDEKVEISGYGLFIKSMDPNWPIHFSGKSRYFQNSVWNDAAFQLTLPNMCTEFVNPERFWFNITKLWTKCPPQKGDKWEIEHQIIDLTINGPSLPSHYWQAFAKISQIGTPYNAGIMFQTELIEIG